MPLHSHATIAGVILAILATPVSADFLGDILRNTPQFNEAMRDVEAMTRSMQEGKPYPAAPEARQENRPG